MAKYFGDVTGTNIKIFLVLFVIVIAPSYFINTSNVIGKMHDYQRSVNYFVSSELEVKLNNYIYPTLDVIFGLLAIIGIFRYMKILIVICSFYYFSQFLTSLIFGSYQIIFKIYDHVFPDDANRFIIILGIAIRLYYVIVAAILLASVILCNKKKISNM